MTDYEKINAEELNEVAGGVGFMAVGTTKTVCNLQSGYLAVRTAPAYKYENEIQSTKLYNGEQVTIAGPYVAGTGINNTKATYAYVYVPKTGVTGYTNAYYLK